MQPTTRKSYGTISKILHWLVIIRPWWRLRNPVPALPNSLPKWQVWLSDVAVWVLYSLMFMIPLSGFMLSIMAGYSIDYFGLFTVPAFTIAPTGSSKIAVMIHLYGAYIIIGLVTLHVLAGLYHHFIRKDNVLNRMMPTMFEK